MPRGKGGSPNARRFGRHAQQTVDQANPTGRLPRAVRDGDRGASPLAAMTATTLDSHYEALLALVGTRGWRLEGVVSRRDAERFALAAGDADLDGSRVHPLQLSSTMEWGSGLSASQLREDGTGAGREGWLPIDGLRLMGGGQDLTFHQPVPVGAAFIAEQTLEAVERKRGTSGDLLLLTIATDFRDEEGTLLTSCRETFIARPAELAS
jgi:hypothetical protein